MQVHGVPWMCSATLDIGSSEPLCGNGCELSEAMQSQLAIKGLLTTTSFEYNRFCFQYCVPSAPEMRAGCIDEPRKLEAATETSGGNGEDWAEELVPLTTPLPAALDPEKPEAAQASDALAKMEAAVLGAGPSPAAMAEQKQDADTGAIIAHAAGMRATAEGLEARVSEAEALSVVARSNSSKALRGAHIAAGAVNQAGAELHAAAVRAAIYAHSAAQSAAQAEKELQEIKNASEQAAQEAAVQATIQMQKEAAATAQEAQLVEAKFSVTPIPGLPEAAGRAAAPYFAVMQRAMASQGAWATKAAELNNLARDLQQGARQRSFQAAAFQSNGNTKLAQRMHAQAEEMLDKAQAAELQSQEFQAIADQAGKAAPEWSAAANRASARAGMIANPTGQPPAVPAG